MYAVGLQTVRPPCIHGKNLLSLIGPVFRGKPQGGRRIAGRFMLLRQPKHGLRPLLVRGKGFVHISVLARHQRKAGQLLMHLTIIRRQHDQHITLLHHLLNGLTESHAVFPAPFLGSLPRDGTGNLAIGIGYLHLPVADIPEHLRIVIGMPLIQIVINKPYLHNHTFPPA